MGYNDDDDEWGWPKASVAIVLLLSIAAIVIAVIVAPEAKIVITKPDGTKIELPESASPEQLRALDGE